MSSRVTVLVLLHCESPARLHSTRAIDRPGGPAWRNLQNMGRLLITVALVTCASVLRACWILFRPPTHPKFPNYPVHDLERMAATIGGDGASTLLLENNMRRTSDHEQTEEEWATSWRDEGESTSNRAAATAVGGGAQQGIAGRGLGGSRKISASPGVQDPVAELLEQLERQNMQPRRDNIVPAVVAAVVLLFSALYPLLRPVVDLFGEKGQVTEKGQVADCKTAGGAEQLLGQGGGRGTDSTVATRAPTNFDPFDIIERANGQFLEGILTEEEYNRIKAKMLKKIEDL